MTPAIEPPERVAVAPATGYPIASMVDIPEAVSERFAGTVVSMAAIEMTPLSLALTVKLGASMEVTATSALPLALARTSVGVATMS